MTGALFFAKDTHREVYHLLGVLKNFSKASGQRINLSKPGLILGKNVPERVKRRCFEILRIPI